MEYKLLNDSIIASQNDKGVWLYKANTLGPFKQNGNLKKEYKDLPRFKVIVEYEDQEVKDFEVSITEAVKDISIKLLSFSR